jgi:hypothetical protein
MSTPDPKRELLRHTLATLAYRGAKTIRDTPATFADFSSEGRTPAQILAHLGDLLDWALSMADGTRKWNESKPLPWDQEGGRFFAALKKFDDYVASEEPLQAPVEKLFQGPVADALTHVGQLAMMRRLAGCPIKAENYYAAAVEIGRVGTDQVPPKRTF